MAIVVERTKCAAKFIDSYGVAKNNPNKNNNTLILLG